MLVYIYAFHTETPLAIVSNSPCEESSSLYSAYLNFWFLMYNSGDQSGCDPNTYINRVFSSESIYH